MQWKQARRYAAVALLVLTSVLVLWIIGGTGRQTTLQTVTAANAPTTTKSEGPVNAHFGADSSKTQTHADSRGGEDGGDSDGDGDGDGGDESFSGDDSDQVILKDQSALVGADEQKNLRKSYRGYYLETFRLMEKRGPQITLNQTLMDEMMQRAKSYDPQSVPKFDYNGTALDDRMKTQQRAFKNFCAHSPDDDFRPDLSSIEVSKHLLYDDDKKIIFCYVPKVGCSNWKRMFVVLNGILPPTESTERPSEDILRQAKKLMYLKPEEQAWRLRDYFKFTMMRNPLERIVSAYRNKVTIPTDSNLASKGFPVKETVFMMNHYEPRALKSWTKKDICPKFDSFLRFLTYVPPLALNEHYRPFVHLCQPCTIKYDLFTNFKYLPDDALKVMDRFKIPYHYYRNLGTHPLTPTVSMVDLFYGKLDHQAREGMIERLSEGLPHPPVHLPTDSVPRKLLLELFASWQRELEFYYAIFPDEKDMHLKYLKSDSSL